MGKSVSLQQWMWRAFLQSALIPLILVETVLVAAYLLTNVAIRDAQTAHLREAAVVDLKAVTAQEALLISQRLQGVAELTSLFGRQTSEMLSRENFLDDPAERASLARTESGVLYSTADSGRAASFYSNVTPPEKQDMDRVLRLAQLDGLMRSIEEGNPLVSAVYFNTHDSYNRIWPWFHTPDQYPHDMDIPHYNFYYLADMQHNPGRQVVWTDMYLDPAGLGWMMSALYPVYRGDFLEGVAGIDITVSTILEEIAEVQVPWQGYAMLVSDELNIMALPPAGEADLGLTELTRHSYDEAIREEIFKPEDFNLSRRDDTTALASLLSAQPAGVKPIMLGGEPKLAAWSQVPETGWKLVTVVAESDVFAQTNRLAAHFQRIGYLLIAGLVLFYLLFFAAMSIRSRQLSRQLEKPMTGVGRMLTSIGSGNWFPPSETTPITELEEMAVTTRQVGTQLAALEQARQEARRHLERVLESTTESLWEVNVSLQEIRFQGRLPGQLGLPSSRLPLGEFFQRIHPEDLPLARSSLLPRHTEGRLEAEYRLRDAVGAYHWVLGRGRVEVEEPETGRPLRLAGTHVDISAIKATQEALRSASLQAQAANVAKSSFLSSMSHELRTPLNIIQGFAQLMDLDLQGEVKRDRLAHQVREILKATDHLCLLVDDVLEFARIESERPEIILEPVDAWHLMRECAQQVQPDLDQAGLRLELEDPMVPVMVMAEPRRLKQVLLNLLSNAIKYNRPGGSVGLDCIRIDDRWHLRVRDSGRGISRAHQKQLFKPFQRLGHENSAIKGTGIGLALSRQLVGLMQGDIGCHTEEDVGSCFWIALPVAVVRATEPLRYAEPRENLLDVVYVEDDRSSQILVEHALTDLARVTLIDNGLEALHQLIERPPQVLLLDLDLPDMQGDRLLRSLRGSARTRDLPVIIITAGVTPADRERVAELDVAMYLTKPLQIQDLRDALRYFSKLQRAERT
ncbi:hybrid sensor histidine kinase/response regulator [Pseudomonas sp.]|uniref:hybrid sensor histidine kinase/response regulator n=1 Tax=Pseudomonas sp. TaxID=306 RepID=UPI00272999B3|nr:ATP-binding protein [Pseudomonas sp.]